jgi:predicted lactoylglutathione lyase
MNSCRNSGSIPDTYWLELEWNIYLIFEMEQRMTIICLGVENLNVSADFYENKFGWIRSNTSNDQIVFFQLNGIQLSLYPREKLAEDAIVKAAGKGFKGFTLAYNTRSRDEVDELEARMGRMGVRAIKKPQEVFLGGYSGYIADPDDNLWEIVYNPYLSLDENGNTVEPSNPD